MVLAHVVANSHKEIQEVYTRVQKRDVKHYRDGGGGWMHTGSCRPPCLDMWPEQSIVFPYFALVLLVSLSHLSFSPPLCKSLYTKFSSDILACFTHVASMARYDNDGSLRRWTVLGSDLILFCLFAGLVPIKPRDTAFRSSS
jgi:hypothetical protein